MTSISYSKDVVEMFSVKQFVEESLVQIAEGIQSAQERVRDMDVKFLPGAYSDGGKISEIEFDIAVTVTQSTEKGHETEGFITVIGGWLGIKGKEHAADNEENLTASRIRFTVQALLPAANKGEKGPVRRNRGLNVLSHGQKL
jgi:hypothetical protein